MGGGRGEGTSEKKSPEIFLGVGGEKKNSPEIFRPKGRGNPSTRCNFILIKKNLRRFSFGRRKILRRILGVALQKKTCTPRIAAYVVE